MVVDVQEGGGAMMVENSSLPRERFVAQGEDSLTDVEILALLLRTGVRGCSVFKLAESLLERYGGSLLALSGAGVAELCEQTGMGKAKSVGLAAAFALSRRLLRLRLARLPRATNPEVIADYFREHVLNPSQEEFHALLLDSRLGFMRDVLVTVGLVDRSLVHAREVYREAIRESCSSVILVHNHPTGDVTPSRDDIEITGTLVTAGQVVGIRVLDHVVVAGRVQE